MDFFIADTHFGHENIVRYCGRPFASAPDMEAEIIRRWNSVVTPRDTVYHLGDFSLYYKRERIAELVKSLNGRIALVTGNHDIERIGWWKKVGVTAFKRTLLYHNKMGAPGLVLSHVPVCFPDRPNIHGHTHGNVHRGEIPEHGIHICVSCETVNYTPVSYEWIENEIRRRQ